MTILIYIAIILIVTAASTFGLWVAGKITVCEGPVLGFAIASFVSTLSGLLIPLPFINLISNLIFLKYITGQSIFPHVILLVIVATFIQFVALMACGSMFL